MKLYYRVLEFFLQLIINQFIKTTLYYDKIWSIQQIDVILHRKSKHSIVKI